MVYIDDHVDALDLDLALTRVSAQRREQALKFRHDNGRRLSLAVYLLLVGGLRDEFGIEEPPVFDYTAGGKPFIPGILTSTSASAIPATWPCVRSVASPWAQTWKFPARFRPR